jgi:hypothetical protein
MSDTCVLVHLAEEVLAVDELQATSEETWELEAKAREMALLVVSHVADHICLVAASGSTKAFPDPVARSRAGDDKLILAGIQNG